MNTRVSARSSASSRAFVPFVRPFRVERSRDATRRKEGRKEGSAGEFSFHHHKITFFFLPPFSEQQQQKKDDEVDGFFRGLINPERTPLKKFANGDDDVKNHDGAYVRAGDDRDEMTTTVKWMLRMVMMMTCSQMCFGRHASPEVLRMVYFAGRAVEGMTR